MDTLQVLCHSGYAHWVGMRWWFGYVRDIITCLEA